MLSGVIQRDVEPKTLADRVAWILDNRRQGDGRPWNASALSLAAGLGRAHVGMIKRGDAKDVTIDTVRAIAEAAKVSMQWLATGAGSPDSLDPDAPIHTDDPEPVAENIPNYPQVEAIDRTAHPEVEEKYWLTGRGVARYVVHGAAVPGDAYKLAKMAREFDDPQRVAKVFADQEARLKAMEAEREADRLRYERELAALREKRAGGGKRGRKG